jgi:hypothetical protein
MDELWTCPNCGTEMKKFIDISTPCYVCPKCGCSIEAKERNFHHGDDCPNCHRSLERTVECPHCGYYLGSDFE